MTLPIFIIMRLCWRRCEVKKKTRRASKITCDIARGSFFFLFVGLVAQRRGGAQALLKNLI